MTILAIDCATGPCSVAIWKDGRIAAGLANDGRAMQSAALIPMIEEALKKAGISYKDLTLVAATTGPGSFTGIRSGLAAARGIALAAGIKSAGFTTLETMAFAARNEHKRVVAILSAGKGEHYYQAFETSPWRALSEPMLGKLEDAQAAATVHIIGPPRADALADLAATREGSALAPFYIRPPDAKLPSKKA